MLTEENTLNCSFRDFPGVALENGTPISPALCAVPVRGIPGGLPVSAVSAFLASRFSAKVVDTKKTKVSFSLLKFHNCFHSSSCYCEIHARSGEAPEQSSLPEWSCAFPAQEKPSLITAKEICDRNRFSSQVGSARDNTEPQCFRWNTHSFMKNRRIRHQGFCIEESGACSQTGYFHEIVATSIDPELMLETSTSKCRDSYETPA